VDGSISQHGILRSSWQKPNGSQVVGMRFDPLCDDYYVDLAGLRTSGSRTQNLAQAKEAFLRHCEAEAIPFVTMAEVLGLDRTTISHRASPELRERRNAQQRQRSLIKPRRRARTKAAVSAAVFAGAW
jgi:hypothetical protein